MCPNIINFDSVDFSEHRPEEVISFLLTLSVVLRISQEIAVKIRSVQTVHECLCITDQKAEFK